MRPRRHRRRLGPALGLLAAALLLTTSGCAVWRISKAAELARQSEPYQQTGAASASTAAAAAAATASADGAVAAPDSLRLLIVGDSTAVGTGASAPAQSLAGLIGRAHPGWTIENRARDGAKMADVLQQLQGGGRFDTVLVQAGGNDVIRLVDADALQIDIERVVRLAGERAPRVVLMPCGNVGNAPFFFAPVSWWMTSRSRMLHRHVRTVAQQHGAVYVNLFRERSDDPFVREPGLHASDGLHPSDRGYANWWQQLQQQAGFGPVR